MSYADYSTTYTTNPNGGAWTWAQINSLQAGVSLLHEHWLPDRESRCTWVWVVVDYTPYTPPTADFTANPTSGCAPLDVQFTDTSTGSPTSWQWDFDNNGTIDSTDQNPSYQHNTPGTYTVKLTATNACGSNDEIKTNYITVNPAPPPPAPTVTSVTPNTGTRGQTLSPVITGTNFTGASAVSFGAGITVNSYTVNSATQITADITIAADATPGARDVSVTTPGGTGTLNNGFTVIQQTQSVTTATGTGTAIFSTSTGGCTNLTAVAEGTPPVAGKPAGVSFPHGLFSFNIINIAPGSTVTITITLPSPMPVGTQYWKYQAVIGWFQIPIGSDDGDNVITIQLTDGGLGDADGAANGTIVDPGGPAPSPPPPPPPPPAPPAPRASSQPPRPPQLPPPDIRLQHLAVSPGQTYAGQPVTVLANVVNNGGQTGSYNVALRINGKVEQQRMVEVSPGSAHPVKFTVTKSQPGTYTVAIDGQKASFTVIGAGSSTGSTTGSKTSAVIALTLLGILLMASVVVLLLRRT